EPVSEYIGKGAQPHRPRLRRTLPRRSAQMSHTLLAGGVGTRTTTRSAGGRGGRLVLLVLATTALLVLGAGRASAATLEVCPSGCAYTQLAPAVAAAHDGDTIMIGAGTYDGGVTVDVSVKLVGAGAT